jgi:hypothetical protein
VYRSYNAIDNLRICTAAQNAARRDTSRRTIAPSRGVFPHGTGYVARIHFAGKRHYLGYFSHAADAQAAYEKAAKEIHGDFAHAPEVVPARPNYLAQEYEAKCECCGAEGTRGPGDIRRDRTRLGKPRGILCIWCYGLMVHVDADKKRLQHVFRGALRYIDRLTVFDEDDPRYQEAVGHG